MYGVRNVEEVNEARLHVFRKLYAPSNSDQPLDKVKSSDPCCLPPCKAVLMQKLKRTNYVAFIWRNARLAQPVSFGPGDHGWEVHANNHVEPIWFEGSQSPVNRLWKILETVSIKTRIICPPTTCHRMKRKTMKNNSTCQKHNMHVLLLILWTCVYITYYYSNISCRNYVALQIIVQDFLSYLSYCHEIHT